MLEQRSLMLAVVVSMVLYEEDGAPGPSGIRQRGGRGSSTRESQRDDENRAEAEMTHLLLLEFDDPSGEDDIGHNVAGQAAITRGTFEVVVLGNRLDIDDCVRAHFPRTLLK